MATFVKTLLIDNYDSFSFNLFQFLAQVNGCEPDVIFNNSISWTDLKLKLSRYDNVVISPGPGLSKKDSDFGVCKQLLTESDLPILGVCLGHQGLAEAFGGQVVHAPRVAHGVVTTITHDDDVLFRSIPPTFKVVRYHSWVVEPKSLPEEIQVIARTNDDENLTMAIKHHKKPLFGVQFHPESVCTEYGIQLLKNFAEITRQFRKCSVYDGIAATSVIPKSIPKSQPSEYRVTWEKLDKQFAAKLTSEVVFETIYEKKPRTFWLDSSRVEKGLSRFSFMGSADGPLSFTLHYNVHTKTLTTKFADNTQHQRILPQNTSLFDILQENLDEKLCLSGDLPFEFQGGFVGYFGYEMGQECGYVISSDPSATPDASFFFSDRFVAFDHHLGDVYLVCLVNDQNEESGKLWIAETKRGMLESHTEPSITPRDPIDVPFSLSREYSCYLDDVRTCLNKIDQGESYELCLTNKVNTLFKPDHISSFYLALRRINPAPFAAYLKFDEFSVLSSSPERFMSISRDGNVETKPIKGTLPRGASAEEDERLRQQLRDSKKDFSENLMIVDLMRNDIGKVCKVGSVHVPSLMNVESYASVHQLVSTVRGTLDSTCHTSLDCIRQSFPPGSMTGAPKKRSIEILLALEKKPRGIYSGVMGFLSVNRACDLSVVIRTAVMNLMGTTIGCGGAIVADSDPDKEFSEMVLKATALMYTLSSKRNDDTVALQGAPQLLRRVVYRQNSTNSTKIEPNGENKNFELLETMLFEPGSNGHGTFFLLDRHVNRLKQAALHFKFVLNEAEVRDKLQAASLEWNNIMRVRLMVSQSGSVTIQHTQLLPLVPPGSTWTLTLAKTPVDSSNVFLHHKTTERRVYDEYLHNKGDLANDVVLWNERHEVTETCWANIAVKFHQNGKWFTPPLTCGLLAGTMRAELLANGTLEEQVISVKQLTHCSEIMLFNSVRQCFPAKLLI